MTKTKAWLSKQNMTGNYTLTEVPLNKLFEIKASILLFFNILLTTLVFNI